MSRSYLFPGMDTEHLTPYQRQLESLYDQVDRPGNRLSPTQFFQSQQYLDFVNQNYGSIPVPPGATVTSQTPTEVRYTDAQGYEHILTRDVAGGREGGQVTEQTNHPAVAAPQYDQATQNAINQIMALSQSLTQPATLATLDPQTTAYLDSISKAEQAQNEQQFTDQRGQLLAALYGNGVQRSSIANEGAARLAQLQGLVTTQQQSNAANRTLQLQQFLSDLQRQNTGQALQGYGAATSAGLNLAGLTNQANIAGAGVNLDRQRLDEAIRQFNQTYGLESLRTQTEQEKLDSANSGFNKFLQTLQAGAQGAAGAGALVGAL